MKIFDFLKTDDLNKTFFCAQVVTTKGFALNHGKRFQIYFLRVICLEKKNFLKDVECTVVISLTCISNIRQGQLRGVLGGKCRNDSRYSHKPHMEEVKFSPVSEPLMTLDRCRSWLKACTRPHEQMNVDTSHIITCAH